MKAYLKNLGAATSQWFHAAIFGGSAKQTMSARIGKHAYRGERWALFLDGVLSLFEPNHTLRAYDADQERNRCELHDK